MLPDCPALKAEIQTVLIRYLRIQVHRRLGVFSDVPRQIVHEGESLRTSRADGTTEDSEMKAASAEMMMKYSDVPSSTPRERIAKLNKMADEMASQMAEHLFGSLNKTLERAGRSVDHKGKPFDAETILAALESIELEFDSSGHHSPLTMVISPAMSERVHAAFEQLEKDPNLRARHQTLIERKFSDWRDREAARKLVG